jgi:hypothetical protein
VHTPTVARTENLCPHTTNADSWGGKRAEWDGKANSDGAAGASGDRRDGRGGEEERGGHEHGATVGGFRSGPRAAGGVGGGGGGPEAPDEWTEVHLQRFLEELRTVLEERRLLITGSRSRPPKKGRRVEVQVPQGLGPGNQFMVSADGVEYPVVVPAGIYGGSTLQLILEDAGNGDADWSYLIHAAARERDVLELGETMLRFFHVVEAQALACQAVQHIIDRSREGATSEADAQAKAAAFRAEFAAVHAVRLIVASIRHHRLLAVALSLSRSHSLSRPRALSLSPSPSRPLSLFPSLSLACALFCERACSLSLPRSPAPPALSSRQAVSLPPFI